MFPYSSGSDWPVGGPEAGLGGPTIFRVAMTSRSYRVYALQGEVTMLKVKNVQQAQELELLRARLAAAEAKDQKTSKVVSSKCI